MSNLAIAPMTVPDIQQLSSRSESPRLTTLLWVRTWTEECEPSAGGVSPVPIQSVPFQHALLVPMDIALSAPLFLIPAPLPLGLCLWLALHFLASLIVYPETLASESDLTPSILTMFWFRYSAHIPLSSDPEFGFVLLGCSWWNLPVLAHTQSKDCLTLTKQYKTKQNNTIRHKTTLHIDLSPFFQE